MKRMILNDTQYLKHWAMKSSNFPLTLDLLYDYNFKSKFLIVSTDVSSGANASYLPAAAMKTYPMSDTGFSSLQPESKVRQMYGYFLRIIRVCPWHMNQFFWQALKNASDKGTAVILEHETSNTLIISCFMEMLQVIND